MVKHTQIVCRMLTTNCLSVFDHFVGLAYKGLGFKYVNEKSRNGAIYFHNYHLSDVLI